MQKKYLHICDPRQISYKNSLLINRVESSWLRTFTPFLVVILTFRLCFLTYDALLFAQTSPRNYRFSQQLVSTIIYHSYELWPRKVVRNLPYKKQSKLRTAA